MSLVKTVEMRVLADAGDAQKRLDELDAKAKDLDGNAIKLRFRLDDAEGKAQLDDLRAKAERLGFERVDIKVRVDGAGRAIAELDAVKHEEDKIRDSGLLSRLGGILGSFPGIGPVPGGAGGIAVLAGGLAALLPEITGIVSGFAAAGAGAGAFALLAAPAVKHVETAYQGLNAAQQAYQAAAAKDAADPTKANRTSLASAALNLKLAHEQISKMPKSEQDAVKGIQGLTTGFGKLSRAFEPKAFHVFNEGLKTANHLLPAVTPFANTFATAMDGLLKKADKGVQSKGFQNFLKQFHSIEGPAVNSIGDGIGKIASSIGKLMTTMSGKDVAHALNIAFDGVAGVITGITYAVQGLMSAWDGASARFKSNIHGIASQFDTIRHGFADTGHYWAGIFDGARHAIASAWGSIASFFSGLPGKIKGFFAGAGGWLVGAGKAVIEGLIHGIESMAGGVAGAAAHIGSSLLGTIKSFLHISSPSQVMIKLGEQTIQGLTVGMQIGAPPMIRAGGQTMQALVAAARQTLGIGGGSGPSPVTRQLGQQAVQGLITGLEGGKSAVQAAVAAMTSGAVRFSDPTIASTAKKLEKMAPSSLTAWLKTDTSRLQTLAGQRKALEAQISQSEQVASSEISNNSIMNAAGTAQNGPAAPVATSDVITGMQQQVATVKAFTQEMKQLKAEGLNATSLSQLAGAGSASGLPVAQALLSGGKAAVAQINQLQAQLKASASKLGDAAAPSMYQAGVQAAQGLALGLKSQLGQVAAAMKQLADEMVRQLKKDLRSHSPSLVFAEIGQTIPQGVALGIGMGTSTAVSASARLAASTLHPWTAAAPARGAGVHYTININGVVDKQGAAREIHKLMRDYKTKGGNVPLGLA